ncbi:MAG: DUF924 family protein [Gammaproteobacteria bacterium]
MTLAGRPSADPARLLDFWFDGGVETPAAARARVKLWFGHHPPFDAALAEQFGDWPARAADGEFAAWLDAPDTALALVLTLDQLPRNIYRATPRAYAFDAHARAATHTAVTRGYHERLHPVAACFFFEPYEHAEDLAWQAHCVPGYLRLRELAHPDFHALLDEFVQAGHEHRDTVARFGRFPHRNAILGRASTPQEDAYLAAGAKTYGQVPSTRR